MSDESEKLPGKNLSELKMFGGEDSMMGWFRCKKCNQVINRKEEPKCHCKQERPKWPEGIKKPFAVSF